MMRRLYLPAAAAVLCVAAAAVEQRPTSESQIRKALERGSAVRNQKKRVPGVAHHYALIMTIGGVRCGHATVSLEEAQGGDGAAYRLRESFKAAMADDEQSAVIDYSGDFLLGADLGLISGKTSMRSDLKSTEGTREQKTIAETTLTIHDGKLVSERAEAGGKSEPIRKTLALHGVKPIPKNALLGLTAFVVNEKEAYSPDLKDAFCVPAIDLDFESDSLQLEPAWIVFDAPVYTNPKGTALQMRVRYLVGEVTEKGLEVEPAIPHVWQASQTWPLDEKWRPLAHPAPSDERIKVQGVDPAALDANAPLDLEKIRAEASKL